jgi:hypothetical protein
MKAATSISGVRSRTLVGGAVASFVACASLVAACSGADSSGLFGDLPEGGAGVEGSIPPGSEGGPGLDGSSGGDAQPCTGAGCNKPTCKDGETTTLRGKVYDPAGVNVLYGVRVFIPSGPLAPLTKGATCDPCGGAISPAPVAAALTDSKGEFVLSDVPVGPKVPVVIQTGKWRRTIEVAITKSCAANDAPDKQIRLPKNGSEGEMPQIAVTTGGCDALECLLRGMGIDDKEFVAGASGGGHVHVFNGEGGMFQDAPAAGGTTAQPLGGELWNSKAKMMPYDALLLSCECSETNENKGGDVGVAGARQAMHDYANAGGRVIASHYHYTWLKNSPQTDWQSIAAWNQGNGPASGNFDVDTSFPRGKAFSDWLGAVNASPGGANTIPLTNVTASLSSINSPAQSWIKKAPSQVAYFSFPTPTVGAACGRVAFTDLHTADISAGGGTFPGSCKAAGVLSEQQKALEFLLFDASSCN